MKDIEGNVVNWAMVNSAKLSKERARTESLNKLMWKVFPSKEQKQSLQQIIDDQAVSGNTRNLAAVLAKINHKPAKADKMLLDMVVSDKNATAKEQNIAKILRNLDHQANNEEKQTLQQMVMTEE